MIKNCAWLMTLKELTTEIPAGTKSKPMLFVSVVPTFSTSPNLTAPVHNNTNNNTKPITDAGIGIGINDSIIFYTKSTKAITMTW